MVAHYGQSIPLITTKTLDNKLTYAFGFLRGIKSYSRKPREGDFSPACDCLRKGSSLRIIQSWWFGKLNSKRYPSFLSRGTRMQGICRLDNMGANPTKERSRRDLSLSLNLIKLIFI